MKTFIACLTFAVAAIFYPFLWTIALTAIIFFVAFFALMLLGFICIAIILCIVEGLAKALTGN